MYYILDCEEPLTDDGEALMVIDNDFEVGEVWDWKTGQVFETEESNVPTPILIDFEPLRGYKGLPIELYDLGIPIMSERLANALTGAGVDNIDFFDAILTNTITGEAYKYRAFNIIGIIAAADLGRSEWDSYDDIPNGDVSFYNLIINEKNCRNTLLFRLAENLGAILIHQHVKDYIISKGIDTLRFMPPEDWVQL